MCGITGFFETSALHNTAEQAAIGRTMTDTIAHRGPDDEGLWQDPDLPLLLGHRRLAIIDLSADGHQPMPSTSGRYVIVFNGEIYNFQSLRQTLEDAGHPTKSRSDTAVLLTAIDHWGLNETLQKLKGMFAFVLWDKKEKTLHLIRDRIGKKPLYVGWAGKTLLFGSELKAFKAHPDFSAKINRDALALYMRYACVPAPYSIYENVWQLLPGCRITLKTDTLKAGQDMAALMEPYWHLPRIVEESRHHAKPQTDKDAIDNFEALLEECVRERMVSDVPLGAFLSGGIDSSAITALMQKNAGRRVTSFSIGFDEAGFDEAAHARKIAAHLGTNHHELYITPQAARDIIPSLPTIYDEPFADASQIPTYLVSRFAREQVTVALSGDGGDEMLGGYLRHYATPQIWKKIGWMPPAMRRALAGSITALSADRWDKLAPHHPQFGERLYKVAEILPLGKAEDIYAHLTSQWTAPETLVKDGHEPLIPLMDPAWQPKNLSFAERMMVGDALSYLPHDVLTKVDRASMAVALEVRAPLLDHRVFEYCWTLPESMKIRNGQGKWLLRQVLARHVPESLFERPKQGFTIPIGEWLRGSLKDWAEDLLSVSGLREQGYLNHELVRTTWKDHLNGRGRHAHKLWTVLMFQQWLKAQK